MSLDEGTKLKKILMHSLSLQCLQPGFTVKPDAADPKRVFKDFLVNNLMDFLRETADEADLSQLLKVWWYI